MPTNGSTTKIFADQVVGAFWRLRRIERAEKTYFKELKFGEAFQFLHTLSDDELFRLKTTHSHAGGATDTAAANGRCGQPESGAACNQGNSDIRAEFRKFDMLPKLSSWDCTVLDGHVPRGETRPKAHLDQQRRAVIRELVRALATLRDLQRSNIWR